MSGAVFPLAGNQRDAVNPRDNVWLSASAGTGKTQVLSARVLRLLLRPDVDPGQILCLTFTKAGAAEMANRINAVLARWVRLEPAALATELGHLGADIGPKTQERARTLFASVLDCPGGGLRIDTIHAFAQWLLANFPGEAELLPGARPMEDRERDLLAREVLSDMLNDAERTQDTGVLDAVSLFATRKDPDALRGWLMRCASAREMWHGAGAWQPPMMPRVKSLLGMPADAGEDWVTQGLSPDVFPDHQLRAMLPILQGWNAKGGRESSAFIERWLTLDASQRALEVDGFHKTLLKADGSPRIMKKPSDEDPHFPARQEEIAEALALVAERRALLNLADLLTPSLELGRTFALRWEEAKEREALLDFDDLIQLAANLLSRKEASDWIRYKLDRRFDHILIDEAQDTNAAQWSIVFALIDDFFSGEGAAGEKLRTVFTVGDYKQAIFGFQGTSPENFALAKDKVRAAIEAARENAAEMRDARHVPNWQDLDLGQSFRTSNAVLEFVNRAICAVGASAFGLKDEPKPHVGEERAGLVTLWNPVTGGEDDSERGDGEQQDWLAQHDRRLADKIADQVRKWHTREEPFILMKGGAPRAAGAGDVMVLVRKRKDLAALIVARLHAKGVPVAGVDRLRLGAPLAVKDLLAALRFAAQPLDDLMLANLLASPLIGWSQGDLLSFVPRAKGVRLWVHVRRHEDPFVAETAEKLRDLLRLADYETPQALLAWLLIGPWQARAKLVARLGREANDPIDELVNSAFAYEAAFAPSLSGFLQWFDAGEGELKRDPGEAGEQVRVMTVHGSKGLQAPIVILADATGNPGQGGSLELDEAPLGEATPEADRRVVPLPSLSKDEKAGRVSEAEEASKIAEMQEHWRLMYVAMTRAEEGLFITGSLGPRQKKGPHEDSWYARLAPLFDDEERGEELADPIWGARREWGYRALYFPEARSGDDAQALAELPDWARTPIGPEPRPPRPLAPSSAGEDQAADPPLPPDLAKTAARRGVLIHSLLERLPDVERDEREVAAEAWLERQASDLPEEARAEMAAAALRVLEDPQFAHIFAPEALAEVPLAATVGGIVVAGTADRLLVSEEGITVVDYKTTRRPPRNAQDVPTATIKQMAAYAAALEAIYPGREVRAAVLYTQTPQILELSAEQLGLHKNALGTAQ